MTDTQSRLKVKLRVQIDWPRAPTPLATPTAQEIDTGCESVLNLPPLLMCWMFIRIDHDDDDDKSQGFSF